MVSVRHFGIRFANDLAGRYRECIVDSVDFLNGQPMPPSTATFRRRLMLDCPALGIKRLLPPSNQSLRIDKMK